MPFQPFQPNFQSTQTSHLPLASSSHKKVDFWREEEEDKENRPEMRVKRAKTNIQSGKMKTPGKLSRRNERERNRVHLLNQGFDRLRAVVPKREGEYLSKISTLRKAIWYIEHLDRVLKEECVSAEAATTAIGVSAEESVADSGVVGTDWNSGGIVMETQSLTAPGHEEGVEQGEGEEEMERLSPIFPPRIEEEPYPAKSPPFLPSRSTLDSGFLSESFHTPVQLEKYLPPPPVRVWTFDFNGASSTPHR